MKTRKNTGLALVSQGVRTLPDKRDCNHSGDAPIGPGTVPATPFLH